MKNEAKKKKTNYEQNKHNTRRTKYKLRLNDREG